MRKAVSLLLLAFIVAAFSGCAGLLLREPLKVTVADVAPLPSEGLEARFQVTLRVQNPNDVAIRYDGLSVDLELAGLAFGSGVSNAQGEVPRFGEALIRVPVTVPFTSLLRQLFALPGRGEKPRDAIDYKVSGRLGGVGLGGVRFDAGGQLKLPETREP